ELEHALRTQCSDKRAEEAALETTDHHLRRGGLLVRFGSEAFEQLAVRRGVLFGVLLDARIDDEAHSTRPSRTQPLWPPRPIAFESATSTCTRRAEGVSHHRFCRGDGELVGMIAEDRLDRLRLGKISERRRGSVRVDVP